MNKREVGRCYEELTVVYSQKEGCHVLEWNYHCRQGEVDLICTQGPRLVFMEVKYRTDSRIGDSLEAMDKGKQRCIRQAVIHYMYSHGLAEGHICRLGVVGILGRRVELVQDVFQTYLVRR